MAFGQKFIKRAQKAVVNSKSYPVSGGPLIPTKHLVCYLPSPNNNPRLTESEEYLIVSFEMGGSHANYTINKIQDWSLQIWVSLVKEKCF